MSPIGRKVFGLRNFSLSTLHFRRRPPVPITPASSSLCAFSIQSQIDLARLATASFLGFRLRRLSRFTIVLHLLKGVGEIGGQVESESIYIPSIVSLEFFGSVGAVVYSICVTFRVLIMFNRVAGSSLIKLGLHYQLDLPGKTLEIRR